MAESGLGLETLTDSGQPPSERLRDANRAKELASLLIENDDKRNRADKRIKGMCDGNAPYSSAKLKKLAQAHRCNINWMEGKAQHSAAMVPYYDLLRGSARMVNVRLDNTDDFLREQFSDIASEEFDRMLKEWAGFMYHVDLIMWDRVRYGKGFAMWSNKYDADFFWVNRFNVHVPDQTRANIDELEVLCVEEDIPVDVLYQYSSKPRWNRDECIAAIKRAEATSSRNDPSRSDILQQKIADKDVLDGISTEKVHAAHVYQKEFSGKISHYVVETEGGTADAWGLGPNNQYLYRAVGEYENWRQCFWATFHEITDGSWNGTSGLGKDIVAQIEIKNRVKCSMVDLGFMRSAINMRAQTAADWANGAAYKNLGAINIFSPGMEPINAATYIGDMEGMFGLDREIEQTLGRNTGIYRQLPEKGQGNPLTATGEMLRTQQATVLTNSAVVRFYSDLDRLYSEVYRRATQSMPDGVVSDMVKDFRQRCKDRGLKLDDLQNVHSVSAVRNIGNGSLIMRQQNLAQLASVAPLFAESGRQNWLRDTVSALTNVETADRYVPNNQNDKITLDHQISVLENHSLIQGGEVLLADSDNHVTHAQTHMQAAVQGLESVKQGADPAAVLAANDKLMPHADIHIRQLEANTARKNEAKMLRQQWTQIARANDQLVATSQKVLDQRQQFAEAQRQAEAIRMQTDPKMLVEAARSEAETEMARQRNAQAMAHHQQKHEQELAIADAATAADIQRQTAKALAEITEQKARLSADIAEQGRRIELEAEKARSDVAAAASKTASVEGGSSVPKIPNKIQIMLTKEGEEEHGKPKSITFERDASGRIKSASVKLEGGGEQPVEFKRDKEGRIASAAVKSDNDNKGE